MRGADPGMPGIGRLAPRLETIPRASVFLAIYTEPCQVPCRHSSSIPTNRPLDASRHDLAARRTKSVTVRAAYARSRRRACPPPRRHQTRIFQAPSAARRPRTRPLQPVEHRNPLRSATELQRCPLQNRVRASRRALQGGPEACDHCEMARSNRPGLPPEANRPPGSANVVDPGAAGPSATCAASAAAPGPQTPPGGPQGRYRERKWGTHRIISTAARWCPASDAGVRHPLSTFEYRMCAIWLDQFFILRKTT